MILDIFIAIQTFEGYLMEKSLIFNLFNYLFIKTNEVLAYYSKRHLVLIAEACFWEQNADPRAQKLGVCAILSARRLRKYSTPKRSLHTSTWTCRAQDSLGVFFLPVQQVNDATLFSQLSYFELGPKKSELSYFRSFPPQLSYF